MENIRENTEEAQTKEMILQKKKMRLNQQVDTHNKRIRELLIAYKNLTFEMNKLNDLFYRSKSAQETLTNENFNIEMDFKQKLKELENESIKLENQIS
jgi:hypothetical protein